MIKSEETQQNQDRAPPTDMKTRVLQVISLPWSLTMRNPIRPDVSLLVESPVNGWMRRLNDDVFGNKVVWVQINGKEEDRTGKGNDGPLYSMYCLVIIPPDSDKARLVRINQFYSKMQTEVNRTPRLSSGELDQAGITADWIAQKEIFGRLEALDKKAVDFIFPLLDRETLVINDAGNPIFGKIRI